MMSCEHVADSHPAHMNWNGLMTSPVQVVTKYFSLLLCDKRGTFSDDAGCVTINSNSVYLYPLLQCDSDGAGLSMCSDERQQLQLCQSRCPVPWPRSDLLPVLIVVLSYRSQFSTCRLWSCPEGGV